MPFAARGRQSSMQHSARLAAVFAVLVATVADAARPTTLALLERAAAQVDEADYEQALITLQDALTAPDNANDDLARIYWQMGEVYVFLNRDPEAAEAFERLLYLSPEWQPPALTPPHVRATFTRVQADFTRGGRRVVLVVPAQSTPEPGRPFAFGARIGNLSPGFTPRVFFRRALAEVWQSAELVPGAEGEDGFFTATLPGFAAGSTVEFYVEVQDARRRRITGEGSALEPRTLRVAGADPFAGPVVGPEPAPSRWWIWAAVGGAVVATGVIAFVALQPEPAQLDLTVRVTP